MKIQSLQISNILSFKYYEDIESAPEIGFEDGMNILIGQNGAGKSTALEVINFIFKKVLFTPVSRNQDQYDRRKSVASASENKNIIRKNEESSYAGFRLDPNWNTPEKPQHIRMQIELDSIDEENLKALESNRTILAEFSALYSNEDISNFNLAERKISLTVSLNRANNTFSVAFSPNADDPGILYLRKYNFYKEVIYLHNIENPENLLPNLYETFVLIGGYRNYNAFTPSVSLSSQLAQAQIQNVKMSEVQKSNNANDQNEPSIFNLVRLRIADKHYDAFGNGTTPAEAVRLANAEAFLLRINEKLALVNLKIVIQLTDKQKWNYSIEFFDTKRNKPLSDINSLSAGQKAIIHLVFEAYGRGDLKGGVVIIDEPEIHLHYQFQYEYLRIINEINKEQTCQYILVTHSESLINSQTINKVKRFALDNDNYTYVKSPTIEKNQKNLIKILDNTRSTYAFFSKKIVLVEGDSDRYFFKAVFQEMKPELNQEIAILDIGGKDNYQKWRDFFSSFGLKVYFIGDFDNVLTLPIDGAILIDQAQKSSITESLKETKLASIDQVKIKKFTESCFELTSDSEFSTKPKFAPWKSVIDQFINFVKVTNQETVNEIKSKHTDIESKIESGYPHGLFILKYGAVEEYIEVSHGNLGEFIIFCENNLINWLKTENPKVYEIKKIVEMISSD